MNEDTVLVQQAVTVTEAEARSCDEGIRINIADANELIAEMAASGGWQLLGFASFNAWASDLPKLKLSREERKAKVADMTAAGLSKPQIAAALGVSERTVSNDRAPEGVQSCTPPEPEYYPAEPKRGEIGWVGTVADMKAAEAAVDEFGEQLLKPMYQVQIDHLPHIVLGKLVDLEELLDHGSINADALPVLHECVSKLNNLIQFIALTQE